MWKAILMTQLFFTDGTYELRNYEVTTPVENVCPESFKERALNHAELLHELNVGKKAIQQKTAFCTDWTKELDFWPIPTWVPVPVSAPRGITI